jgi:hypothetical protein
LSEIAGLFLRGFCELMAGVEISELDGMRGRARSRGASYPQKIRIVTR